MTCHLEHRLPWESLRNIYIVSCQQEPRVKCCPPKMSKQLDHFAACLHQAVVDFRTTAMPTESEMSLYDTTLWGGDEFTPGGFAIGYFDSLFWGYLELNLLLLDHEKTAPLMVPEGHLTPAIRVMIGESWSGLHPDHLTQHLQPAFADDRLQPMSADTVKIIRDHAAMLFRCMYLVSGENKLLHEGRIRRLVYGFFDWNHFDWKTTEDGTEEEVAPRCCPWITNRC